MFIHLGPSFFLLIYVNDRLPDKLAPTQHLLLFQDLGTLKDLFLACWSELVYLNYSLIILVHLK